MSVPRYEVFQGSDGDWYWHLKAGNGETVASSEGYTRPDDAYKAAKNLAKIARSTKDPEKPS